MEDPRLYIMYYLSTAAVRKQEARLPAVSTENKIPPHATNLRQ